jgi:hypothetical protein
MPELSVKIFDNEQGQLDNVVPRVRAILTKMGYVPNIDARVVDLGIDAERLIDARPDIVICDNDFGDEGRQSLGFNFVSRFKPLYPDCIFVIMTQEQFTNNEFGKLFPHPDLVIWKSFLNSEDKNYERFVTAELGRLIKRAKVGAIALSPALRAAFQGLRTQGSKGQKKRPITETEIHSLVEQMCYMGRPGPENTVDTMELDKIDEGMSHSVVATVALKGSSHSFKVPGVAKFSTRQSALTELENHSRYVKWTLPYTWRVDVIGSGVTGEFGVVCYSFAHGGSVRPVSLDQAIKAGDAGHVAGVIGAVLDPDRQTWYAESRTISKDLGAYLSTDRPYFVDPNDWDTKLGVLLKLLRTLRTRKEVKITERRGAFIVEIGNIQIDFSNFINFLFAKNWGVPVIECICHGDMHGGNIMVKPNSSEFAFIDFRHTGWHHRARDFCSLEGSIRTWFPRKDEVKDFIKYFERECSWIEDGQDLVDRGRYGDDRSVVGQVRNLFLKNFKGSTYLEYILATLVHSIWMLSFDSTWAESQKEILLAKILAEMSFLQKKLPV